MGAAAAANEPESRAADDVCAQHGAAVLAGAFSGSHVSFRCISGEFYCRNSTVVVHLSCNIASEPAHAKRRSQVRSLIAALFLHFLFFGLMLLLFVLSR